MTLHPIRALEHITNEYRDYIFSEFRARDIDLKNALEHELDEPGFLAQEPYFQAHRPFKSGKKWSELPLDPKFARVLEERSKSVNAYQHQSIAIERLLSKEAGPLVVSTGTGSGKTEAFLVPVLQNALADASQFKRRGLTAILVYPMNALATDQQERIEEYLEDAGLKGAISVARYDRGTSQSDRQAMRESPPHILLTNYMMLEYLLVRPADREAIFANHRCRFLVLDEVHSYRGALGANVAMLVRRLRLHLRQAVQDWGTDVANEKRELRFPSIIPVGTSATIKSVQETNCNREEALRERDRAVQGFFSQLTGETPESILVVGEELTEIAQPDSARYSSRLSETLPGDLLDQEYLRQLAVQLSESPPSTALPQAAGNCKILWDLNSWLVKSPVSVSDLVRLIKEHVSERSSWSDADVRQEVLLALNLGCALLDGTLGALRLRTHRFIRGGWKFTRCVAPDCGRVYPKGEEGCSCGAATAPLYLCRNCGAHYLMFRGDPAQGPLVPGHTSEGPEALLYQISENETVQIDDDEDAPDDDTDANGRRGAVPRTTASVNQNAATAATVSLGSFDPNTFLWSDVPTDYRLHVARLAHRRRCVCCGGTSGSRTVITPVCLGTSAALKVLTEGLVESLHEENDGREGHDGKERLLIFSDSRQDAAHQARFIIFASRYDRMRRLVYEILSRENALSLQRIVERLGERGLRDGFNPYRPENPDRRLVEDERNRLRVWEEAPLLDDLSTNPGYRATVFNLGLVGIRYHELEECIRDRGQTFLTRLGMNERGFTHLCTLLLDQIRKRGALSRELLRYHFSHPRCPEYFHAAQWERKIKSPQGFACDPSGNVVGSVAGNTIPGGMTRHNIWRAQGAGGRGPMIEQKYRHLLNQFGAAQPQEQDLIDILSFLVDERFLVASELCGFRDEHSLLQVNQETVYLEVLTDRNRFRCDTCGTGYGFAAEGLPCVSCQGRLTSWAQIQVLENRAARRLIDPSDVPLVAREHTAQIATATRLETETNFKAPANESPLNVLACSPTLEMGIDVGGLDAVALRNIPPRPDNYAQRGGRAGRRSRVGLVIGYARNTPHDQYFFDKPTEMIAGEVPAPVIALGNRNVVERHINAIVFSLANPGLSTQMAEYVTPLGEVRQDKVDELTAAVRDKVALAIQHANEAFSGEILERAGLDAGNLDRHYAALSDRIANVIERTAYEVRVLRQALDTYSSELHGQRAALRAGDLTRRLLGLPQENRNATTDADDRSAGYPLRRFAEFGILPGYEFPTEPSSLRLIGDRYEDDPLSVARRFGIAQFQPEAHVYARGTRWKVVGLDTSSPWNPRIESPSWEYVVCRRCDLRYRIEEPRCRRCGDDSARTNYPAYEFGGFAAVREEAPVLDEEERYAVRNSVTTQPQWNGEIAGRWIAGGEWPLVLSRGETVIWLNEGQAPKPNAPLFIHPRAEGFSLCSSCGKILRPAPPQGQNQNRGRRRANNGNQANQFGHRADCPHAGIAPTAHAIATTGNTEVLRLRIPIPLDPQDPNDRRRALEIGYSLGSALRIGMKHHFMLDGSEIDLEVEGPWTEERDGTRVTWLSLSFVDPSLGGTGYLRRAADELKDVAVRAIDHLDHPHCEKACYRCLKSYANQRHHELLSWPLALPYLEALADEAPSAQPGQVGDTFDPRPWLEAFAAGVGSPLELRFWKLFEQNNFRPEKQLRIVDPANGRLVSIADFAVSSDRVAIYIDGASVHVGENLRRDRYIRRRLREDLGWQVVEYRARDLQHPREIISQLLREGK